MGWEKGVAGLELEDLLILGVYMAMYITYNRFNVILDLEECFQMG